MTAIIIALVPLIIKLIDKFIPDRMTQTRDFHMKKRVINRLTTIEQIARYGRKEGK